MPTITVAAVGLVGQPRPAAELLGVGALGLLATLGLAGWAYLAAWGALGALEFGEARGIGAAIGVAAGLIVFAEVMRVHRRSAEKSPPPARRSPPV